MIGQYVQAIEASLEVVLELALRLAMPVAIMVGLVALAAGLSAMLQKENSWLHRADWGRLGSRTGGLAAVALVFVAGWSGLRAVLPIAREDLSWRQAAEATSNPVPDAPAAEQYGPSIASMVERTYSRTLTLPPNFMQRIGEQGIGVLAPYLSDPSAENVLKLADDFKQSGQDVIFTRTVTRLDEEPLPFTASTVNVRFRRLSGRAYDADFEGRYLFENPGREPIDARFLFPLPAAGTVRDLSVTVGGQAVLEPKNSSYEWKGRLAPREKKEAVVRYRALGSRAWNYDLGSNRRRVQQLTLTVSPGGPVRYLRGSIQPTSMPGSSLRWNLSNVVTAQRIALALPPESESTESCLQALSGLPASLALFAAGLLVLRYLSRRSIAPGRVALALALFALGLGASVVLANYVGPAGGILLGPAVGALMAALALEPHVFAVAIPCALLPGAFLSPRHSGLLVLLLAIGTLLALRAVSVRLPHGRDHA